jgi:hypothetical protein
MSSNINHLLAERRRAETPETHLEAIEYERETLRRLAETSL